jgi:hypothetical protein
LAGGSQRTAGVLANHELSNQKVADKHQCSWITKCSKFSSYVFILWDHILNNNEGALSHSHLSFSKVLVYFGGWGGGELSTFQESLATRYFHPHPTRLQIELCLVLVLLVFLHITMQCMSWQMSPPIKGWQRHY